MLYLDAPAGSNDPIGFSTCSEAGKGGEKVASICKWNDKTQAVAYAHTLLAFYKAFPEFAGNDLYLTGESYAGQYLPNIASTILTSPMFNNSIPRKAWPWAMGAGGGPKTLLFATATTRSRTTSTTTGARVSSQIACTMKRTAFAVSSMVPVRQRAKQKFLSSVYGSRRRLKNCSSTRHL